MTVFFHQTARFVALLAISCTCFLTVTSAAASTTNRLNDAPQAIPFIIGFYGTHWPFSGSETGTLRCDAPGYSTVKAYNFTTNDAGRQEWTGYISCPLSGTLQLAVDGAFANIQVTPKMLMPKMPQTIYSDVHTYLQDPFGDFGYSIDDLHAYPV